MPRVQIDLPPTALARLAELRRTTEAASNAEVIRQALRAYERVANGLDDPSMSLTARAGEEIAERVRTKLADDASAAAATPLSAFGQRSEHYKAEKQFLAARFIRLLAKRFAHLVSKDLKIYLLIDSGTTLFPHFGCLASEANRTLQDGWSSKVTVVTNNIPGIVDFMSSGRRDDKDRYSPLAVDCFVLPGKALAVYGAITGDETIEATHKLRENSIENREDAVFIGLLTGNWVWLTGRHPVQPLPAARGEGHVEFKQAVMDVCNEVYVVSPLGKIFIGPDIDDVNAMFGYESNSPHPDKAAYETVKVNDENKSASDRCVTLVTTDRPSGCLLARYGSRIRQHLGVDFSESPVDDDFVQADVGSVPHLVFQFEGLPRNTSDQLAVEFPHVVSRQEQFTKHFLIDDALAARDDLQW